MKRFATALAVLTVGLAALAPAALAHEGNPDYRSLINRVTPAVAGVELEVQNYDSHMQLVDRGHEVLIYGYEEEPYARILKDGSVQLNQRSPATFLNEDRYAEVKVPRSADADAAPVWKTVDGSGTFTWHDHRMHYMATGLPPQVRDESKETKVFDYRIPIRVDGQAGAISGTLIWVGPADTSKLPFLIAAAVIVVLGGGAVLLIRRRRAGGGEGGEAAEPQAKEAW